MTKSLNLLASLFVLILCAACAPRGEHKTLSELLDISKTRYKKSLASSDVKDAETKRQVSQLVDNLDKFAKDADTDAANEIVKKISQIASSAGYTSRPGFAEIKAQFQTLASLKSKKINKNTAMLIASRTINLIASELNSTSFNL